MSTEKLVVKAIVKGGQVSTALIFDGQEMMVLDEPSTREVALKMLAALEIAKSDLALFKWLHQHGVEKELVRTAIMEVAKERAHDDLPTNTKAEQAFETLVAYSAYLLHQIEDANIEVEDIDAWAARFHAPTENIDA